MPFFSGAADAEGDAVEVERCVGCERRVPPPDAPLVRVPPPSDVETGVELSWSWWGLLQPPPSLL
ncbi:hypothetical protein [Streptomyces sp. NPDC101237]|uniref:hypothetical protein n=1 Tax=Streptomyces sp. NPDC101237 TaxID=3366139 RepID=UPI0038066719